MAATNPNLKHTEIIFFFFSFVRDVLQPEERWLSVLSTVSEVTAT